ncbi:MAG TPA: anti-sigma factor [Acidimicrobiales bacterium]|nr:anti-sigma factor [Acidimicrobiales bacterium]
MTVGHDDLRDLVAAYALDAVDQDEVRLVEDHMRECPRCRSDVATFREVAARLAHTGVEAPAGVWERVVSATRAPAPPPIQVIVGSRRLGFSRGRVVGAVVGGAAAAAIAALALVVVHQGERIDQLSATVAQDRGVPAAVALLVDPAARHADLTTPAGATAAVVALGPDGIGYLVPVALPALPAAETYQLWTITDGRAVSAGVAGSNPVTLSFRVGPGPLTVAITVERAGGVPQPTTRPVASAAVA